MMERSGESGRPMSMEGRLENVEADRFWFAALLYGVAAVALWIIAHWVWALVPMALGVYAVTMALVSNKTHNP